MTTKRLLRIELLMLFVLFSSTAAQAQQRTWTFEGEITQRIASFAEFQIGDPYTLTVDFDTNAPGTSTGTFTAYTGSATFTSSANASDASVTIRIADAPNLLSVSLEDPDATLPNLELVNSPGESREASRVTITLQYGSAGSEDIQDYLILTLPSDPADRSLQIVFPGVGGIVGSVDSIQSSGPVPTGGHPWLLLPLLGLLGWGLLGRSRVSAVP